MLHPAARSARRYDLDWLRVLSILAVFFFHSSRFFDHTPWHVKSATTYFTVQVLVTFMVTWMMPLIFVVSGASLYFALARRGPGAFIHDRLLRLGVPLVVGIFTHVMWQVYLERRTHHQFGDSFWQFIPHYFSGWYGFGGNFAWMGLHLWYLEVLLVFSVALLPLFWWLRRGGGQRVLSVLARALALPGVVYLLAVPTLLLTVAVRPDALLGMRDLGGWSLPNYAVFLLAGFMLFAHDGALAAIRRLRWLSLAAGLVIFAALGLIWAPAGDPVFGSPRFAVVFGLFAVHSWAWILAILGFALQHLNRPAHWLDRANEAVLPFYVLHQTVLLTVGYVVLAWTLPDLAKWAIIAAASLAICLGLYEYVVRRINLLRWLFGMKLTSPASFVSDPVAPRAA
jgi:peptidoglycan/LPS O-acetylase OafA/YrhL